MNYSEKLKNPKWQKKRLEILERDKFMCQDCWNDESTLHVHHIAYTGNNPWETPNELLITLCEGCHNWETEKLKAKTFEAINNLKGCGFMALSFEHLPKIFAKDRNWAKYEPAFDVLAMAVEDDKIWEALEKIFWDRLEEKREKSNGTT